MKKHAGEDPKPLAPNTVRLARAPLAGALKLAVRTGMISASPMTTAPRPRPKRSLPKHWTPEEARTFLGFMGGDRTRSLWAFPMGSDG